jgi:PAS domain S-box-containing protein
VLGRAQADRDAAGRISRWYGTCTEIEEIVQARSILQRSRDELEQAVAARTGERNLLARILETTDVMILAIDLDHKVIAINKANADEFERIFGARPRIGDDMLSLLAGHPAQRAAAKALWARAMAGEEFSVVETYGDPARARAHYEINLRALRDDAGRQIGVFEFVYDISAKLAAEAQLAQAREALLQAQKLEAMGQLTGGVAHDFNNLLTPIIGSLDLLQRRRLGGEREQRLIDGAFRSAERAKVLVQRLLAFARRQPLQSTPIDIGDLVHGISGLVASTVGPQIVLRVDVAPALPRVKADANQLEMALLNLSVNARDAVRGAGQIRISASAETVDDAHKSDLTPGHYLRLSVADNGMGMDEATRARAIEPFFSTKGIGKGTGLGLSMAHGLALQLGGGLTITSQPGQGTEVSIWLPECAEPVDTTGAPGGVSAHPLAAGSVLLVDDEEYIRLSTADMLAELGFSVHEAPSAEAALVAMDRGLVPDLLITDHLMPGMTGIELAAAVSARLPATKILIVSGFAEADGIDPSLPRLTKPFVQSDLAKALAGLQGRFSAG